MSDKQIPKVDIKPLSEIFKQTNIKIPDYQRPYKWQPTHVNQLIDDILFFGDKTRYRLGTIVIHQNNANLEIVDGQQRFISCLLIAKVLLAGAKEEFTKSYSEIKTHIDSFLNNLIFDNPISQKNISANYETIFSRKQEIKDQIFKDFFFHRCELVQVVIYDISEAFQFFDSQNARGKDLSPHDLLKAYHLREMQLVSESQKMSLVSQWEAIKPKELKNLFAYYLYPIREWSKRKTVKSFTKDNISVFKGINLNDIELYPFVRPFKTIHAYMQNYNQSIDRFVDSQVMPYPFAIDQVILNGQNFFEMVSYYSQKNEELKEVIKHYHKLYEIYKLIDSLTGTGDGYIRRMFDCAVLFYWDKFGEADFEKAVKVMFRWAYWLRIKQYSIYIESINNHAIGNNGLPMFEIIARAIHPKEITQLRLPNINIAQGKYSRKEQFKDLIETI